MKQELVMKKVVENGGNVSRAMREVGYSQATINNPSNLTHSKGFIQLCEESGLTDDLLLTALVEDIRMKKGNRRAELELAFKIKGHLTHRAEMVNTAGITIVFDDAFYSSC